MRVLTISGSRRINSSNSVLLESFRDVVRGSAEVLPFKGLADLPHFDPDVDDDTMDFEVVEFRELVNSVDLVYFSTPEYIHAMPAVLKNGLEWLVGDSRFYQKRVVILQTNNTSMFASRSLREVLLTMSARVIDRASQVIPLAGNRTTVEEVLSNSSWRELLKKSFDEAVRDYLNIEGS